jgi:radical SAM protein with 4Fe4S-binding SPASM domain
MEKLDYISTIIFDVVSKCSNNCVVCLVNKNIEEVSDENLNIIIDFINGSDFTSVNDIILGQGDMFEISMEKFEKLFIVLQNKTINEISLNTTASENLLELDKRLKYLEKLPKVFISDFDNNKEILRERKYKLNYVFNPLLPIEINLQTIDSLIKFNKLDKISFQFLFSSNLLKILSYEKYLEQIEILFQFIKDNKFFIGFLFNVQTSTFSQENEVNTLLNNLYKDIFIRYKNNLYNINDFKELNKDNFLKLNENFSFTAITQKKYNLLCERNLNILLNFDTFSENFFKFNYSNINLKDLNHKTFYNNIKKEFVKNSNTILNIEKCKDCKYQSICKNFPFFIKYKHNKICFEVLKNMEEYILKN